MPVRVTLRSRGLDGERTELSIRQGSPGTDDVLATLPITLADGEQAHELVIDADRAKGPLAVEVQAVPHEAIAANNVVPFQIMPREIEAARHLHGREPAAPSTGISTRPWKKTPTSRASRWPWTTCTPSTPGCIASPIPARLSDDPGRAAQL